MGSWTNRVVQGIAILGLAAAPAVALLAPVPAELLDSAFGSEWMARTVLGLATLAIASLVNFYVGYLVLEGALPAKIQLLGQAVDLASSAAGDLRQASEAVARTEKGLTETADQMRVAGERRLREDPRPRDADRRAPAPARPPSEVALEPVTPEIEKGLETLSAAVDWLDDAYEETRQTLIDGLVVSGVVLTSLALMPYVDGGGLITALAFIGIVQALDLVGRALRGLVDLVRRTPSQALHE